MLGFEVDYNYKQLFNHYTLHKPCLLKLLGQHCISSPNGERDQFFQTLLPVGYKKNHPKGIYKHMN